MDEERTRFQKIVLLILAAMAVLFAVLTAVSRSQKGAYFEETLLRPSSPAQNVTAYTGKAHGTRVDITVTRDSETRAAVEFLIEGVLDDVCVVDYPLDPIRTERWTTVDGVRVTKNGTLLFEGGYDPEDPIGWGWYTPEGVRDTRGALTARGYSDANPWLGFEVSANTALRFALGPELESRGSWALYFLMLFCTFFVALDAAFPMTVFYLQHCCDVRDPEPSDFYLACQKAGWVVFPLLLLAGYCYALRMIP